MHLHATVVPLCSIALFFHGDLTSLSKAIVVLPRVIWKGYDYVPPCLGRAYVSNQHFAGA